MKIGILTQPLQNNYGGLLQAYALQEFLKRKGSDVVTIDRVYSRSRFRFILSVVKGGVLYCLGKKDKIRLVFTKKELRYIRKNTNKFILDNISTTSKIHNTRQLSHLTFDAYIVGSDQVWRPMYSPCISNYFLDFLKEKTNVKKIAYAASFGVDVNEYTRKQIDVCTPLVSLFRGISVREEYGIKLCKELFGVNAEQVLDPTLLLDKQDYIDLVEKNKEEKSEGDLFAYILDKNRENSEIISFVEEKLDLTSFFVMPEDYFPNNDIDKCIYPTVTKWLRAFMDAKFIVTDSFHGCVFSILFNKPFIAIANETRGRSRFNSLLKSFGLMNRLIDKNTRMEEVEALLTPYDCLKVNEKFSELKKESILFLDKNLN